LSQKRRLGDAEEAALTRHLTALHLSHALSEHRELTRIGASAGFDPRDYLLRLAECEVAARRQRRTARLIRAGGLPPVEDANGAVLPPLAAELVSRLADTDWIEQGDNVIALGGDGTGKTRLLTALGRVACDRGVAVRYATAATLADELVAAFEERRLLALHRRLENCRLLLIDDLGATPLSAAGAALLFEVLSRRSERLSTVVASALPPLAWSRVFGTTRLSDAVGVRLAWRLHRVDLGGVAALPWSAPSEAEKPIWHAVPVEKRSAGSAGRRRTAAPAPARSA
jgi:DNA replication protein DnaC